MVCQLLFEKTKKYTLYTYFLHFSSFAGREKSEEKNG